ncbi:MAG: putative motility protein [Deltaproteobacteria bacterium]
MSDIAAIAATMMAMSQSQTQDKISMSILKMSAEAEQAMADMLLQNARQVQALAGSSSSIIDLYA